MWKEATDRHHAWFRDAARRNYETTNSRGLQPWKPPTTDYEVMLGAHLNSREIDPFEEWLAELPDWDGHDRCETLLARIFDVPLDNLSRWASRYPMLAAVERTYQPGAKIDEHPVLFGPQGIGKSAMFAWLLPNRARDDWFGDKLELDGTGKEQAEALAGRVIVEIAELTGYRKADIERMKAFLTRRNDGQHRGAFARHAESAPRRCAIVMTANPEMTGLPNDPSGNRRFVAVNLSHSRGPVEPLLDRERHQLWAETVHKYRNGTWPTARLPRDLITVQTAVNEAARDTDDAFEDRILKLWSEEPATLLDIAAAVGVNAVSHSNRLQAALRNAGWTQDGTRVRREGKQVRLWHPPDPQIDRREARYIVGMTALQMHKQGLDTEDDF